MLDSYMFEIVDNYIENEKEYIKQDMETCGHDKDLLLDLNMLENLTPNEKQEIANNVLQDGEIEEKINELIHYYLYHR